MGIMFYAVWLSSYMYNQALPAIILLHAAVLHLLVLLCCSFYFSDWLLLLLLLHAGERQRDPDGGWLEVPYTLVVGCFHGG
jgi:hypothetical protein